MEASNNTEGLVFNGCKDVIRWCLERCVLSRYFVWAVVERFLRQIQRNKHLSGLPLSFEWLFWNPDVNVGAHSVCWTGG